MEAFMADRKFGQLCDRIPLRGEDLPVPHTGRDGSKFLRQRHEAARIGLVSPGRLGGPVGHEFEGVEVVHEAGGVEAHIAEPPRASRAVEVGEDEDAAERWEEGLNDFDAGVADVEVVDWLAGIGIED